MQGFQGLQPQAQTSRFQAPPSAFQAPPSGFQAPPSGFQAPSSGAPPVAPPKVATPLPIPAEAQGVHTTLNGLYTRALQMAPNMVCILMVSLPFNISAFIKSYNKNRRPTYSVIR